MSKIFGVLRPAFMIFFALLLQGCFCITGSCMKSTYGTGADIVKESYKNYSQDALEALNPANSYYVFYPIVMPLRLTAPLWSVALYPVSPIVYYLNWAIQVCNY